MDEYVKVCYVCGVPLSPGAHRRIGTCVNCIAEQKEMEKVFRIPEPKYGRQDEEMAD